MIDCAFCGAQIPKENVTTCLLDGWDVTCHECGTVMEVVLEIKEA